MDTFEAACRKADLQQRRKRRDKRIEKLKSLTDNSVSLEHAYAEIQRLRTAKAKIDVAQRRREISSILADIEENAANHRHLPENDAAEARKIIARIERKLGGQCLK